MDLKEAADRAVRELETLVNKEACGVVRAFQKDGKWYVDVEMLERRALPDSQDLLATYEIVLNGDGQVAQYERKRMRRRMEAWEEAAS